MTFLKLASLLVILITVQSFGQSPYKNITISSTKEGTYPPCEPSIAIDPTNTNNIVAGAILDRVYTSEDGGQSWKDEKLTSIYGVFGDPCVVANSKGDFFYLHLSDPSGKGWFDPSLLDRIVLQKSTDKGKTWSKGSSIGHNGSRDQDKEWAAINPDDDCIHVTWTEFKKYGSRSESDSTYILYSKSNHKAKKWSEPVRLNKIAGDCLDGDGTVEGAVPAVGPNGEVYVAWALNEYLFFDRSLDGGETWLNNDMIVSSIKGGWDFDVPGLQRANGLPVTCADYSNGAHSGNVYVNWCDQRNGEDDTDVWISRSSDHGLTWSDPIRINDDSPGSHQFFTWMSVDQSNGNLYCVFYDRRHHEDNNTDVYLATSVDGGLTWVNERISEVPFEAKKSQFLGDYNNIASHNGKVIPIWTHQDDDELSIKIVVIEK